MATLAGSSLSTFIMGTSKLKMLSRLEAVELSLIMLQI
jgi:hypothetical protein